MKEAKLMSFAGYKVGMCHANIKDNKKTSMTKDNIISLPLTIIDCPPIKLLSLRLYQKNPDHGALFVSKEILLSNEKILGRTLRPAKELKDAKKEIEAIKVEDYVNVSVICYTQPSLTTRGNKKPEIFETGLGGSNKEKIEFIKNHIGKEIKISDVFSAGDLVDITGVTKGKGFQGTVKRFGVPIRQHKSEKTKRGVGTLGPWHPHHVLSTVPQPGKMGYHTRTEYNKWIVQMSNADINPKGGFKHYGLLKNDYILIKGSVAGPSKRVIRLTRPMRPDRLVPKEGPEVENIFL